MAAATALPKYDSRAHTEANEITGYAQTHKRTLTYPEPPRAVLSLIATLEEATSSDALCYRPLVHNLKPVSLRFAAMHVGLSGLRGGGRSAVVLSKTEPNQNAGDSIGDTLERFRVHDPGSHAVCSDHQRHNDKRRHAHCKRNNQITNQVDNGKPHPVATLRRSVGLVTHAPRMDGVQNQVGEPCDDAQRVQPDDHKGREQRATSQKEHQEEQERHLASEQGGAKIDQTSNGQQALQQGEQWWGHNAVEKYTTTKKSGKQAASKLFLCVCVCLNNVGGSTGEEQGSVGLAHSIAAADHPHAFGNRRVTIKK